MPMNHMAFINQANNCEFEFKQNYRIQSSSSHILHKSVYQHPKCLVEITSILKFKFKSGYRSKDLITNIILEVKKLFQLTLWQKWLIPRFAKSVPFMGDKNQFWSSAFPTFVIVRIISVYKPIRHN